MDNLDSEDYAVCDALKTLYETGWLCGVTWPLEKLTSVYLEKKKEKTVKKQMQEKMKGAALIIQKESSPEEICVLIDMLTSQLHSLKGEGYV